MPAVIGVLSALKLAQGERPGFNWLRKAQATIATAAISAALRLVRRRRGSIR